MDRREFLRDAVVGAAAASVFPSLVLASGPPPVGGETTRAAVIVNLPECCVGRETLRTDPSQLPGCRPVSYVYLNDPSKPVSSGLAEEIDADRHLPRVLYFPRKIPEPTGLLGMTRLPEFQVRMYTTEGGITAVVFFDVEVAETSRVVAISVEGTGFSHPVPEKAPN